MEEYKNAINNKSTYEDFVQETALDELNSLEDKKVSDFLEIYQIELDTKLLGFDNYKPLRDSSFCRTKKQDDFYVYYSFPKGSDTPIASFWGKAGDSFKFFNINMGMLVNAYIRYKKNRGFVPPPPREYNTSFKS